MLSSFNLELENYINDRFRNFVDEGFYNLRINCAIYTSVTKRNLNFLISVDFGVCNN